MTDILTIFLLILIAILIIGPKRLPQGIEQLWLLWENFRLNRYGADPINMEQARKLWAAQRSLPFISTRFLYETAEHLDELRRRMFFALIAFAICTVGAFVFSTQLFELLLAPLNNVQPTAKPVVSEFYIQQDVVLTSTVMISGTTNLVQAVFIMPQGTKLPLSFVPPRDPTRAIQTKPTEMVLTVFKVALFAGLGLAMPFIIYELIAFIMPALLPHEKRYVFFLLPAIAVLFVGGVVFSYYLMLPFAVQFLFTFGAEIAQPLPVISEYINFAISLLFVAGLTFQTPVVIYFLALIKVVNIPKLKAFRRYAIVLAFIIAALVTPTPDPLNQVFVALPLILLYEVGIIFARFT